LHLVSTSKPPRPDVWVTEIRVSDHNVTQALQELIKLVKKHEGLSGTY
jgi:hypothetical protein